MWRRYLVGNPRFLYHVWREHRGALRRRVGLARLPIGLRSAPALLPMVNGVAWLKRQRWNLTVAAAEACKRSLDIVACGTLLLALAPLFALVAVLIKLESPGPVFFRQQRVGLWGKSFSMWKFRSMYVDAEARKRELSDSNEQDGPIFKMKNDPRMTPIGRLLRRSSIDELPQLLNVLMGDMSLVGPRPLPTYEIDKIADTAQRRRLSVKPGLTCLWQISGRNKITSFDEWVSLDLKYIDNWSIWLDFVILLKTIPVVFLGSGAK